MVYLGSSSAARDKDLEYYPLWGAPQSWCPPSISLWIELEQNRKKNTIKIRAKKIRRSHKDELIGIRDSNKFIIYLIS